MTENDSPEERRRKFLEHLRSQLPQNQSYEPEYDHLLFIGVNELQFSLNFPELYIRHNMWSWDDERVFLEIERWQLVAKVGEIDERIQNKTISRQEYNKLSSQYREWREDLDRRLAAYEQRKSALPGTHTTTDSPQEG